MRSSVAAWDLSLLILGASLAACEPVEGGGALLDPHQDGVKSRVALGEEPTPEEPLPTLAPHAQDAALGAAMTAAVETTAPADALLPTPPESDADAVAALEALPDATPTQETPGVETWGSASVTPTPSPAPPVPPAASAAPCGLHDLAAVPLADLSLIQVWPEGTSMRATLASRAGQTFVVERGSIVGPSGAKVVRVVPGEVALAEVQFDLQGQPVIVSQTIRPPLPR